MTGENGKQTVSVILNDSEERNELLCCTLLFKFGFMFKQIRSQVSPSGEQVNQASPLVLVEQINAVMDQSGIKGLCSAQPKVTTIYFEILSKEAVRELTFLFEKLLNASVNIESFEKYKNSALKNFSKHYSDEKNRAFLKALEFAGYEEQFRLSELIYALENITFEEYSAYITKMFHVENVVLFFDGKLKETDVCELVKTLPSDLLERDIADLSEVYITSNEEQIPNDYNTIQFGRKDVSVAVYKFYFDEFSPEDMFLYLLFVSAAVSECNTTLLYDNIGPSIICLTDGRFSSNSEISDGFSEERFSSIKQQLMEYFKDLLVVNPQEFGSLVTTGYAYGVNIFKLLEAIPAISLGNFSEAFFNDNRPKFRLGVVFSSEKGVEGNV